MAAYETIRYHLEGGVATVTLDRAESLNSLNKPMRHELKHAFERAPAEGARAVLLTGAGRSFCSGQDLGESGGGLVDVERTLREEYEPMLHAILDCPLPVICAVNGVAAGAGASLALLADIVLAGRSAQFVIAFARIGLMPDVASTYFLPRLIGLPRAMGMAMTTEPVDGAKAAEWGLVWKMIEDADLKTEAQELASGFANGPTRSFELTKKAMRAGMQTDLVEQLAMEARGQAEAAATRDFAEGSAAFMEKRKASFEGR
jgi:2-(1,2-epoxy-1,2-dihydrophenyl)acetyl-CoA isomerase